MRLAVHWAGEAGRPVVVLLHGLFGSARNLGGLQRAIAVTHRVAAIDLRNHGDSPHAPAMDYDTMADDVRETLTNARDAVAVLGHSMGGKVAMRLALRHPALVARLIVADIAPVTYPSHFGAYVAAMLTVPDTASRAEADVALTDAIPDPAIRSFLLHSFRSGSGWRVGLRQIAGQLPVIEGWEGVGTHTYPGPALFIDGARSDYVSDGDWPRITTLFPAATRQTIPDAGHWLHAEQPAAFNAAVLAFLG